MEGQTLKRVGFEYKWVIAAVCFLMVFAGLGFCSSSKSIYLSAITEALGFSRSAFSINDSCRFVATAIANLFFAELVAKFGTKKLIAAGMGCLIISTLLYSWATNLWIFYIGGVFLGLGIAWTTTTMVGVVIKRWFHKNRGTVLGAILASNGVGAAVSIHMVTPIIYQEGNPFGYQEAYRLTALILLIVTVLILAFYKENPPKCSEAEVQQTEKKKGSGWAGFEYKEVRKKPYFCAVLLSFFIHMVVSVGGITTPHFTDIGLDPDFVAFCLSLLVILLAVFKFGIGFLYDWLGIRVTINICLVSGVLSKILLLVITNSPMGRALTISYNVLGALATPIETVMLPILVMDLFGEKSFDKILGILTSIATIGQALGTPVMNIPYDISGNYYLSFVCSLLSSVLILIVMNWAMKVSAGEKLKL